MSKEKRRSNNFKASTRPSYAKLGISIEKLCELQNGCRAGIYSSEILSKACAEFKFVEMWILLSVTKGYSYDTMMIKWELRELERAPVGKNDFYAYRRIFFHNLDSLLKHKQENVSHKRNQ